MAVPLNGPVPKSPHGQCATDAWLGWLFVAGQFILLGALVVEVWGAETSSFRWALGVLAAAGGGSIAVVGSRQLGRELRTHPAPSSTAVLRVDGPYRFVRHPIYSGLLLLAVGLAVIAGTVLAAVTFLALFAMLSLKARFEERLLAERFPGYREYARRTPRFVPRLSRPSGR